jgi:ribosomal protein S18 acetylase RimI-like enzyme
MVEIRSATPADAEEVYELLDARSRAAFGVSEVSRDAVARDFKRTVADRWVAVREGEPVGYAHLSSSHELVHAARDPDVGDALLALAEARARTLGFDAIEATVVPEDVPLYGVVTRGGFAHERDVLRMWRPLEGDLPEPAWPSGVRVRTYEHADARRVHELLDDGYSAWDASFVALAHDAWLAFMTGHDEFDPELWFLVERDGDVVACALHWKEHQRRGWLKDLVVRSDQRGAGLGKALLHLGLRAYAKRATDRVGLKVDSANPTGAIRLYEHVGFETDRRYGIWRKEL